MEVRPPNGPHVFYAMLINGVYIGVCITQSRFKQWMGEIQVYVHVLGQDF